VKHALRTRVLAVAMAASLIAGPALATAGDTIDENFKGEQFFDYAMCATGIALCSTGAGLTLALLACGKVVLKYWN
jgi:hypothetical protein